jgi:hypothetical protein
MYRSTISPDIKTLYNDLVFNPSNYHLVLVGTIRDAITNAGYLFHEFDLTSTIPFPVTFNSTVRRYNGEGKSIEYNQKLGFIIFPVLMN